MTVARERQGGYLWEVRTHTRAIAKSKREKYGTERVATCFRRCVFVHAFLYVCRVVTYGASCMPFGVKGLTIWGQKRVFWGAE